MEYSALNIGGNVQSQLCRSCWEQIDVGSWANGIIWLKPGGSYFGIRDDQIYILKPDREENLSELQVCAYVRSPACGLKLA